MVQVKRNDPCPCGSGQKYKRCCMARDKAAQADRVAWERAARDMGLALIGYAKGGDFVRDLAAGLGLFWQDRYTAETVHLMSVDESLRFFDWFAHDYRMRYCDPRGGRLIEIYRQQVDDALSDKEAAILDGWIASPPGSAFLLEETSPEEGTVLLRDLFTPDRVVAVHDTAAAKHGELGQILLARPLPEHEGMRLSGSTVVLPASEVEGLIAYIEGAYQGYLTDLPGETALGGMPEADRAANPEIRARFLRDRAYLFTHYALAWAEHEGRAAVAAQDPDARKPGGDALRKVIRWSQERVQVR